ncbi:hypothetical protein ACFL35_20025 [Candidatus Riflebacteria bacterium]
MNPVILSRASQPFSTVLGTLDAIHFASFLIYQELGGKRLTFCTHDVSLQKAAKAGGFPVLG